MSTHDLPMHTIPPHTQTCKHTCTALSGLQGAMCPPRPRSVPDNRRWRGVKPLAPHDLVAKGSGIKTQGVLGIPHDKRFHRVTPGHHAAARSPLIDRKQIRSLAWKRVWCHAGIVPRQRCTLLPRCFGWPLRLARIHTAPRCLIYNQAVKVFLQLSIYVDACLAPSSSYTQQNRSSGDYSN